MKGIRCANERGKVQLLSLWEWLGLLEHSGKRPCPVAACHVERSVVCRVVAHGREGQHWWHQVSTSTERDWPQAAPRASTHCKKWRKCVTSWASRLVGRTKLGRLVGQAVLLPVCLRCQFC